MARTNLGKIVMIPKGTYSTTVTYSKLDVVTSNGSGYISKSDNNLNKPLTNETYWMKLVEKGDKGDKGDSYIITEDDIQEIEDYVVDKTSDQIIATRNELERVKNDVLETGTDTDTYIHLEDSAMAEYQELSVDGVCEQNTTTGKNKLNLEFSNESSTLAGMTFAHTKSEFTLNGTATGTWGIFTLKNNLPIVDGKTYSLSANIKGTNPNMQISLRAINGSNKLFNIPISNSNNYKNTVTASFTDEITKCEFVVEGLIVGEVYNLTAEVQFEESSAATDFEPYTGGQPSPSPDYPQEIKTITDNLSVTSCNKNVFKITSPLKHHIASGVDISINDNVITLNGTATGVMWPDFIWGIQTNTVIHNKCKYYFSEQPEDCIASINVLSGTATGGAFIIIANDDGSSTFGLNFSNLQNTKTFKANGVNRAYLAGITSGTKFDNFTFEIMLEKGSVATAFERHIESQIQANLPENEFIGKLDETYKDTLRAEYNKDDGQYHLMLDKKVGKYTFTGDEEWFMNYGTGMFHANNIFSTASELTRLGKCTHYIYNSANYDIFNSLLNNQFAIQYYGNSTNIHIKDLRYSSIDDFKNMLKTNNIEIYYILKTPYTLDLGVIDMPLSYNEVTNIFTDSDLLPKINAKYYRNFITTVQNLQVNEKALKQELVDINARLSALESASVMNESEVTE